MNERAQHDRVVRWVAANRFPFPDQTNWPTSYVTITNESGAVRGLDSNGHFPDIVIVDGATQRIAEIGEVVTELPADAAQVWAACSAVVKQSSTGARAFFVYAPPELVADVQRILDEHAISYAGVRSFAVQGDQVAITPVVTLGDRKDHR